MKRGDTLCQDWHDKTKIEADTWWMETVIAILPFSLLLLRVHCLACRNELKIDPIVNECTSGLGGRDSFGSNFNPFKTNEMLWPLFSWVSSSALNPLYNFIKCQLMLKVTPRKESTACMLKVTPCCCFSPHQAAVRAFNVTIPTLSKYQTVIIRLAYYWWH